MNKTVFISGATRNTGLAIARRFASEGYNIAISSRDAQSARLTAQAIAKEFSVTARGYGMLYEQLDAIRDTFRQIKEDFGGLDVFVANSANLGINLALMNTNEADFDAVADVNIKGNFFCCQCAAQLMKEKGGSIITIGSVQGTGAVAGRTVYAMSKAAISIMVKYMACELGQYGIRVNNVVAGAIHSERWDVLSEQEINDRRSRYPAGRESTEDEIASAVYFLASEQNGSITGTDLTIDSGITACLLPYQKKEWNYEDNRH